MTVLNTEIRARELTPDEYEVVCGACNSWATDGGTPGPCVAEPQPCIGNCWGAGYGNYW
jgi:hypothetical protein